MDTFVTTGCERLPSAKAAPLHVVPRELAPFAPFLGVKPFVHGPQPAAEHRTDRHRGIRDSFRSRVYAECGGAVHFLRTVQDASHACRSGGTPAPASAERPAGRVRQRRLRSGCQPLAFSRLFRLNMSCQGRHRLDGLGGQRLSLEGQWSAIKDPVSPSRMRSPDRGKVRVSIRGTHRAVKIA